MVDVKQRIMEIQRLHAEKAAPVSPAVPQLGRSSPPALVARATAAMQEMARRRGTAPIVSTVASPEQSAVSTNVAAILSNEATPVGVRRFDATYTLPGSSERKTIRIAATDLNSAIAAVEAQLPGAVVIGAVEVTNSGVSAAANGPGDYLHDAIRRWIGASPSPDCACKGPNCPDERLGHGRLPSASRPDRRLVGKRSPETRLVAICRRDARQPLLHSANGLGRHRTGRGSRAGVGERRP